MKKLNLTFGIVLLCSIFFISSSFTNLNSVNGHQETEIECTDLNSDQSTPSNQGNGNIVTIDNGQTWIWIADNCFAPYVQSTSARVQSTTNGFYNLTIKFQLPEGHCDIPAIGAKVTHYGEDSWAIVNSKGEVTAKIVYNPEGN